MKEQTKQTLISVGISLVVLILIIVIGILILERFSEPFKICAEKNITHGEVFLKDGTIINCDVIMNITSMESAT